MGPLVDPVRFSVGAEIYATLATGEEVTVNAAGGYITATGISQISAAIAKSNRAAPSISE